MIAHIIRWSINNRFMVLLMAVIFTAWGIWAVKNTPLDAIPDLSDVQVIVKTSLLIIHLLKMKFYISKIWKKFY